jgi:hypothetical protein
MTHTDHHIQLTMDNLNCSIDEAIEALDDAINLDERLAAMGLADERGGDYERRPNWRDEL